MIEPNMATMLVFILTDIAISRSFLRKSLAECAANTFNRISIDGDQSTSDTALLISSGRKSGVSEADFQRCLHNLCWKLAEDIVRNGEGTRHVIRTTVKGALDDEHAAGAAKAIVNSPLVKTAVFGNDPNVGRLLSALGDYMGNNNLAVDPKSVSINMGGLLVFDHGAFNLDVDKESHLSRYLMECRLENLGFPEHEKTVDIEIHIGEGPQSQTVLGSDLSHDYIEENAEYRS